MTARAGLALVLLLCLALPAGGAGEPAVVAAAEPVLQQLEAFRRGDFDTAYTFASDAPSSYSSSTAPPSSAW